MQCIRICFCLSVGAFIFRLSSVLSFMLVSSRLSCHLVDDSFCHSSFVLVSVSSFSFSSMLPIFLLCFLLYIYLLSSLLLYIFFFFFFFIILSRYTPCCSPPSLAYRCGWQPKQSHYTLAITESASLPTSFLPACPSVGPPLHLPHHTFSSFITSYLTNERDMYERQKMSVRKER